MNFCFGKCEVLTDKETAERITIICTTNPIPSIPSTKILYESMNSLYQIPAFRKCKKLIVFDGIQPGYEHLQNEYEEYKKNVQKLTEESIYFSNTELIFCFSWEHLSGAIGRALTFVKTPFIFIHQHDFALLKKFDLNRLITSMEWNWNIKHVRLNQFRKNKPEKKKGYHYSYDGDVDDVVEGGSLVSLSRTFGWSDNDHVSRTDYYRNFVLTHCGFGAMEWFLHPMLKSSIEEYGPKKGHRLFGTYLYGDLEDGKYLRHLDGRGKK